MDKTISVVIPVYNVQDYLSECLESVIHQTEENLEILVVDDGSTDHSYSIMEEYAKKDARIQLLQKENGGLSDARNYGLDHMHGEYVIFVDSDDRIALDMVEKLSVAIQTTNSQIAVCDMEYFYDDGTTKFSSGGYFTIGSVKETPSLIRMNNSACNKMFHKDLWKTLRFPKGKWYEDLAVIPTLLYLANQIVKVDEPLYFYRQRSGSIAHSADERIFDLYDAIYQVKKKVLQHGGTEEVLKEIEHLYIIHGLDLTTLRIKDFEEKEKRASFLEENMKRLGHWYPEYEKDEVYRKMGWRKKMIFSLLKQGKIEQVLKIYDR